MLILIDQANGSRHLFQSSVISIGRVTGNDLVLDAQHVSSKHAKVRLHNGTYFITDLGSTNGSFIQRGDERLLLGPKAGNDEVALQSGDMIVVGDVDNPVQLLVEIDQSQLSELSSDSTIVASRRLADYSPNARITNDAIVQGVLSLIEALNQANDTPALLTSIVQHTLEAIPPAVDALIAVPEGQRYVTAAAKHRNEAISTEPDQAICKKARESAEALLYGSQNTNTPAQTLVNQGLGSGIAAPLVARDEHLGILQVNCSALELGESHLNLIAVYAHHAATILDRAKLIDGLRHAQAQLREENAFLKKKVTPEVQIIADAPKMVSVLEELKRAARSDVTVLLEGETGTGKEVAARYLHAHSKRSDKLLVPVNCGALTETLLDSELFGHRKGAFTGAGNDRKGVFEMADGGTVFLDEVGEMPLALQVRLLRVLEEGKIRRVGDSVERAVNVRIVAATNRDLRKMVGDDRFREDLYYRLRVFPLCLPPLRERLEDIPEMVKMYAERFAVRMGRTLGGIDSSFIQALQRYHFPGNVRELVNEIERAVVRVDDGEPLVADLLTDDVLLSTPPDLTDDAEAATGALRDQLARHEKRIIEQTLARHHGKKIAAADELGLTRQGLAKKIDRLGVKA